MPGERILIFGGTAEARALAAALIDAGFEVVTSLAGVTTKPNLPEGETRVGGLGGSHGIAAYVARKNVAAIVDATHPFAIQISSHAHSAATDRNLPYLRLERPAWRAGAEDHWTEVPGMSQAMAALPKSAQVMLTIGRKELSLFLARPDLRGFARMIEPPGVELPDGWTLVLARPPFNVEAEKALMQKFRIGYLVTKNSGSEETEAKLIAARELKIPVIMVARPVKPKAPSYSLPEDLIPALRRALCP
jgi:precorrin-6A/cobalt-precorrin-6A reductase